MYTSEVISVSVRGRLRKIVGSRHCSDEDDVFTGVPLVEVRRLVLKSELFFEGGLVDQVLHLETIILPRGESLNLSVVVCLKFDPFSFIGVSNFGEIAWVNLSSSDVALNLGNFLFSFKDA